MFLENQNMQPFIDALKCFFDGRAIAPQSFQELVSRCLGKVTVNTLAIMTETVPDGVAVTTLLPTTFSESASATVGFAGMYSGSVAIHCPMVLAGMLAARMTGADGACEYEDVHDAMGELANVLAGEIKQSLSIGGLDIQLSTPTITSGAHYVISTANHHHNATVMLMINRLPFYVTLVAERNSLLQAAAEELKNKREWLSLALDGGNLGLWSWDLASSKVHFSEEWAKLLGYDVADLIPEISTWESLAHPEDVPGLTAALRCHLAGGCTSFIAEHRLLNKQGEWRWFLTKGRIVEHTADQRAKVIAGTHLDIHERKQAELALAVSNQNFIELNEQLEERVAEELHKNREKDSMLFHQEKLASIGQLAAGVAHEINNPIGFITGNLNTMQEYATALQGYCRLVDQHLSEEASAALSAYRKQCDLDYILDDLQPLLNESVEGAERVRRIVLDLKDFARTDDQEPQQADLNQLISSTINMVRNEIRYVAELNLQLGDLPPLQCHPQQINQVITNLAVNAAHAIKQQGTITIRTWHDQTDVLFSVADTGKGIPQEIMQRIFDPFFTTKDVGKGTGLGLSISYDIVTKHGGQIYVVSEVGVGTTFTVKLPIAGPPG